MLSTVFICVVAVILKNRVDAGGHGEPG